MLATVEFADQKTLVPELNRLIQALTALQTGILGRDEQAEGFAPRRARQGISWRTPQALLDTLDKISAQLAAAVNHSDPVIDQLLMIKQTAWLLRNTAGEASLLVSNGLAAGHVTPEIRQNYTKFVGGIETAWNALETVAAGTQLAARPDRRDGGGQDRLFRPAISRRCATG